MTKFADQLFTDLMREHGPALERARPPVPPKRHVAARRATLVTAAGCLGVGAIAGTLVASSHGTSSHAARAKTAAYAVTKNPNGTVTLAVYKTSGIAAANARLHQLDEGQVVIVPVGSGCPSMGSLPAPAVPANGPISVQGGSTPGGSITVNAQGIPAGDILVVASEATVNGPTVSRMTGARLTSPPAPSCVSMPAPPSGGVGPGARSGSAG
jgi:hypothetical protein